MQAQSVRFEGLEGRLAVPEHALGAVVLFHAYPPLGGSMSNTLIVSLQRCLFDAGWASLRFNSRGVGRSAGVFDHGVGETADALAAVAFVREKTNLQKIVLVGWSFGSMIALRASSELELPVVAIAPPVSRQEDISLPWIPTSLASDVLVIAGSKDPVCQREDLEAFARPLRARVEIVDQAGHFFENQIAEVCGSVTSFISSQRAETADPQRP
ncbi:MAG: alpha/beta hydrolase [Actinomycetota bacterium]